jgi:transcriptional repressor NrdR
MVCTYCGGSTQVVNSRHKKRLNTVWRRRECKQCGSIVTTEEAVNYHSAWLIEHSGGKLESFSREKLLISLYKSLAHRPNATQEASHLVDTIMGQLRSSKAASEAVLPFRNVRDTALLALERFDPLAAAQYLAYHK